MNLPISSGSYPIDDVHSQIGFSVVHLGLTMVRGTFDSFGGSLTVGDALEDVSVVFEADMKSVSSSNPGRDEYIQGEGFFESEKYPTMSFRSTSVTGSGSGPDYELVGDLTIRDLTHPATLAVTYNGSAEFPLDGSVHHGFSGRGTISRSAYGVSYGVPLVTDEVGIELEVQFVDPAGT